MCASRARAHKLTHMVPMGVALPPLTLSRAGMARAQPLAFVYAGVRTCTTRACTHARTYTHTHYSAKLDERLLNALEIPLSEDRTRESIASGGAEADNERHTLASHKQHQQRICRDDFLHVLSRGRELGVE